eukprot:1136641-Pelagomonas_calceolata.AAC.5
MSSAIRVFKPSVVCARLSKLQQAAGRGTSAPSEACAGEALFLPRLHLVDRLMREVQQPLDDKIWWITSRGRNIDLLWCEIRHSDVLCFGVAVKNGEGPRGATSLMVHLMQSVQLWKMCCGRDVTSTWQHSEPGAQQIWLLHTTEACCTVPKARIALQVQARRQTPPSAIN